jgi:membrane protease YdiL (CAAX protease family)
VLAAAARRRGDLARTIGLNAVLGGLYGWCFATRNLEHAMLAHGATHGVFWTATPLSPPSR